MRKKPFAILAIVALGAVAIWAQGSYGTWFASNYPGNDVYGPLEIYPQFYTRTVGTRAQCSSPAGAYGQWVGIYWAPYTTTCPNDSIVFAYVTWPDQATQATYYLSGRFELDVPPNPGPPQAFWLAYNWCGRYQQWPSTLHGPYCNYGCDGTGYRCGNTW